MSPQQSSEFSEPPEESIAETHFAAAWIREDKTASELLEDDTAFGHGIGSRYERLYALGHGGMGAVWLAYDRELQRTIALKILHSWLQRDAKAMDRLRKEVLIASSLSHPNIVKVHDLVDCNGQKALSMEHVEGQTLAGHINKTIRLQIDEVVRLGKQICSAIQHAHQRGVIHCDIKPHNILLTVDGDAKVCDFGLALALDCNRSTTPGAHAGSLAYMAPEVALGASPTVRSDIYSFGIVLYQMLTGEVPPLCLDSNDCTRTRLRVSGDSKLFDGSVPEWLTRIVVKCTVERPINRYSDIKSVLNDLKEGEVGPRSVSPRPAISRRQRALVISITFIVLTVAGVTRVWTRTQPEPLLVALETFTDSTRVPSTVTRAIAAGLQDSVTTGLSRLSQVRVVTRPAGGFGASVSAKKPSFVVRGRVTSSESKLHAQIRLITPDSNRLVREFGADGTQSNISAVVNHIVVGILPELDIREYSARQMTFCGSSSESAAERYLLARGYLQGGSENMQTAHQLLKEAIKLDSGFTLAYTQLAALSSRFYEQSRDKTWLAEAVASAERAYALDPAGAEALQSLANAYRLSGRANQTIKLLRQAASESPRASSFVRLASAYADLGLSDEAIAAYSKAVELDTWNARIYVQLGVAQLGRASYCDAIGSFKTALSLEPESVEIKNNLGSVWLYLGNFEEAVPYLEEALQQRPVAASFSNLGTAHLLAGRSHTAIALFERARALEPTDPRYVGNLADAHRWANYKAEAAVLYRRAIELSTIALKNDPDNAKEKARMAIHLARLGKTQEAQEYIAEARIGRQNDPELTYREAVIFALAGDADRALRALERAYRMGIPRKYIMQDPDLRVLHSSPQFSAILAVPQPEGDCKG